MTKWRVVGWIDDAEWEAVYYNLYCGDKECIQSALDQIAVWQARMGDRIPVAVEATAQLFQCYIHEADEHDPVKRQSMATAIGQFAGLLTEKCLKGNAYNVPIHKRAEMMGIPGWVINLRHEAAHRLLPSYTMLAKGVEFALDWLKVSHWDEQHKVLREESESEEEKNVEKTREKLISLLRKCICTTRKLQPIDRNCLQQLCKALVGKPDLAEKLCHILVENNFISFAKVSEDSYLYCRHSGQALKLDNTVKLTFGTILRSIAKNSAMNVFLSLVVEEMKFPMNSAQICFIWVELALDVLSANTTYATGTINWPPLLYQLVKASAPSPLQEKAMSLAKLDPSSPILRHINDLLSSGSAVYKDDDNVMNVNGGGDNLCEMTGEDDTSNTPVPQSWTIYDGDLSNCPFGLMPGQEKATAWQSLNKFSLPKAGSFDKDEVCVSPAASLNQEYALSLSELRSIGNKIDLF